MLKNEIIPGKFHQLFTIKTFFFSKYSEFCLANIIKFKQHYIKSLIFKEFFFFSKYPKLIDSTSM